MKRKGVYSVYNRTNFERPFNLDSPNNTTNPSSSINSKEENSLIIPQSQNNGSIKKPNDHVIKQKNTRTGLKYNSNHSNNTKTTSDTLDIFAHSNKTKTANNTLNIFAHSNTKQPTKYTPPSISFNKTTPLKIPSKKRSLQNNDEPTTTDELIELEDVDADIKSKKAIECPYCHDILSDNVSTPLPKALQEALNEINNADKQYNEYRKRKNYHVDLPKRRRVTNMEQFTFCQLHQLELRIRPEGIKNGYPIDIDFRLLETRVKNLRSELLKLINDETDCHFRKIALKAYSKLGKNRARNTISVMNRFEDTLPGYYGPKGATVIMNTLTSMFLHSGILTKEKIKPQLPVEYIQQVLVPETGLLLIQDDIKTSDIVNKHKDQATKGPSSPERLKNYALLIMNDSREFGNRLYPAEDDIIDSTTVQNMDGDGDGDDDGDDGEGKYNELNLTEVENEKMEFLSSSEENE
ncbi:unnamed protein product [Cunninghamella blakesleeana]